MTCHIHNLKEVSNHYGEDGKPDIAVPERCFLCGKKDCRFELANLDQKYSEIVFDWGYMCSVCYKRCDSEKYHWNGKDWDKRCTKCGEMKNMSLFYQRKSTQTIGGKTYPRNDPTSWCIDCTKEWGNSLSLAKKALNNKNI